MGYAQVRAKLKERAKRRSAHIRSEIPRLTEELKRMGAERVILFGSRARGEQTDWSDADLLVVMPSDLPFVERIAELYRVLHPFAMDILAYTPEEFAAGNPVIRAALAEGKVLYEKAA
jgi:predicted nucleotidyltransferase